jgi:hypothetical protein
MRPHRLHPTSLQSPSITPLLTSITPFVRTTHSASNADDSYKARALEDTPRITAFQRGGLLDGNA